MDYKYNNISGSVKIKDPADNPIENTKWLEDEFERFVNGELIHYFPDLCESDDSLGFGIVVCDSNLLINKQGIESHMSIEDILNVLIVNFFKKHNLKLGDEDNIIVDIDGGLPFVTVVYNNEHWIKMVRRKDV